MSSGSPTASPTSSILGGSKLVIDNLNTQILTFVKGWNQADFNATQTGTEPVQFSWSTDEGASISFIFPQAATAVFYYGLPQPYGGIYNICIDCDSPGNLQYNETVDAAVSASSNPNWSAPRLLYSKHFDKPGVHSVVLTNARDPKGTLPGNSRITIDNFVLMLDDDPNTPATETVTVSANTKSATTSSAQPKGTTTSQPLNLKKSPVGAIAGGVVGGLVLLALISVLVYVWHRKSRQKSISLRDTDPTVQPFYATTAGGNGNQSNSFASPDMGQRYEEDAGPFAPLRTPSTRTNPPLYNEVFAPVATDARDARDQSGSYPTKPGRHFRPYPQLRADNTRSQ